MNTKLQIISYHVASFHAISQLNPATIGTTLRSPFDQRLVTRYTKMYNYGQEQIETSYTQSYKHEALLQHYQNFKAIFVAEQKIEGKE